MPLCLQCGLVYEDTPGVSNCRSGEPRGICPWAIQQGATVQPMPPRSDALTAAEAMPFVEKEVG